MTSDASDALVLFGATGDLARKQIWPALHAMQARGALGAPVVGVAKAGWDLDRLRSYAAGSIAASGGSPEDQAGRRLLEGVRYVDGDYADPATFDALGRELGEARRPLFYLAIPPSLFATVVTALGHAGLAEGGRVVVEKPFGHDLASARALNGALTAVFPERCTFRIDHFLGKEPVENLMYFRFANSFLEPVSNRDHVESVQITKAEDYGVSDRGRFYDETGAIRDVVQNHLLQMVCYLAMEPPADPDPESTRDEKVKVLKATRPLDPGNCVRGQFRGYRDVPGVAPHSTVETYAAVRLHIDSWRWHGVPFCIRAGKCLPSGITEVRVQFRRPPQLVFGERYPRDANYVRFRVEPDVAIAIGARTKTPGERMVGHDVELSLAAESQSGVMAPYDRLLGDALEGDAAQFAREDTVEAAWRVVEPILGDAVALHEYEPGTWGPAEADRLVERVGGWQDPSP